MKQRMDNNGLSVKEAKKRIRECHHYAKENKMLPLPATAGNLFLPMTTNQPALQSEFCEILSGVNLIFLYGTQVNIKCGSVQAVMSFGKERPRPYQQRCKAQAASRGGSYRGGCRTGRSALQQGTDTTVQDQGRDALRTHPHALHQEDIPCAYVYAERQVPFRQSP